jgi:hypothetical protein
MGEGGREGGVDTPIPALPRVLEMLVRKRKRVETKMLDVENRDGVGIGRGQRERGGTSHTVMQASVSKQPGGNS